MICTICTNLQLSAYAYFYGNFDFNRTPLVPPGTKAVTYNEPKNDLLVQHTVQKLGTLNQPKNAISATTSTIHQQEIP